MRTFKFIPAFAIACVIAGAALDAYAQATPPAEAPAPTPPMSAEDAAKLRDQLKQIGVVFGVERDKPAAAPAAKPADGSPQPPPAADPTPKKTMAEVADRALSIVSGLVASVSQSVQKAAPEVWRIMIRQQYAKALADLVVPWSMFLFMVMWWLFSKKKIGYPDLSDKHNWNGDDTLKAWMSVVIPAVFGFCFFIWGANRFSDSAKYLINPEYYAVRDILIMVMQPGQTQ